MAEIVRNAAVDFREYYIQSFRPMLEKGVKLPFPKK